MPPDFVGGSEPMHDGRLSIDVTLARELVGQGFSRAGRARGRGGLGSVRTGGPGVGSRCGGWAVRQARKLVWYCPVTNPPMAALGRSTLARLINDVEIPQLS